MICTSLSFLYLALSLYAGQTIQDFNNMFVRRQVTAMPTRSVTSGCFQLLDCRSLVNKYSILHRGAVLLNFLIANGINLSSDKCQEGQYFKKVLKESTKLLFERSYHKTLFKQNVQFLGSEYVEGPPVRDNNPFEGPF